MASTTKLFLSVLVAWPFGHSVLMAGPTGGNVISGVASIDIDPSDASRTVITQTSQNTAIDWDSFNIAVDESVVFAQPNADSIALNRDFSGSPSQIFGSLDANGNVFLLNTAGVLIGSGATINVGGLLVSDLNTSDEDARNFESIAGQANWSLPFSDADLAAGGIEVLGTIQTVGQNGITMTGQYIYIEGDVTSVGVPNDPGGNITMLSAGSTVLVTDPNGLYGVEITSPVTNLIPGHDLLFEIPESATDANVLAVNGNINIEVAYDAALPVAAGTVARPGIDYRSQSISTIGDGGQPIRIVSTPVVLPGEADEATLDELDNTVTDSLAEETDESDSTLLGDSSSLNRGSLDSIMESCIPKDQSDKDCIRQNAIKRYLGKLLIGGSLPD
ncbi:filamentous hemagglutinin N-terminal domain-containing protein [Ketobacter sp.]|uniref:two-partner secretion domain-containing protein n=1 Tax=Ketobacter sp. TaxID=2083498 RepID=UPI000F1B51F9|nr:filamentous hemagglutinin N-terminal domain-containing protein [Ketobacter sp.]RLT97403.1 MAG: filamentous hemagglutinin N-terminal domain-containing protein [Ketobacter sp.]